KKQTPNAASLARTRMRAREKSLKNFRLVPWRRRYVQRSRALAVIIPIMPTSGRSPPPSAEPGVRSHAERAAAHAARGSGLADLKIAIAHAVSGPNRNAASARGSVSHNPRALLVQFLQVMSLSG